MFAAGLPNVEGRLKSIWVQDNTAEGAFLTEDFLYSTLGGGGGNNGTVSLMFNATKANKIYGTSETVQPAALNLKPQIKY